jgi:tRNA pseudouridine38-40 synthase
VNYHYRLTIQYKGTQYLGWQIQPQQAGKTVQGCLNLALTTLSKSENIRTLGAGRTDAGVHALGQIAKVSVPLNIPPENLVRALNANLPDDIRVIAAEVCDENFMPTVHAISKEYHYRFTFNRMYTAFQNDFIANHPFDLDVAKMNEACKILIGEHDFTNFFTEGTAVNSTIRTILDCHISRVPQGECSFMPEHYVFKIVGTGFLKQMVRLLVGAVWNVGRGKIELHDLKAALGPVKTQRLGVVAPPEGLYMVRVNY